MQFITGVYLLIELTWFNVFGDVAPLLAGLAFTVYCIHWFAMAHRRYIEATAGPDGWVAIAFLFLGCEVAPDADTSDQQGITKIGSIFEFIAALPPWMASRTTATS
jgi:hypothetical protein